MAKKPAPEPKARKAPAGPKGPKKPPAPPRANKPPPRPPGGPAPPPAPLPPPGAPLSEAERRFVEEYVIDRRAAAAYRRCHPEVDARTAQRMGLEVRRRPNVRAEIIAATRAQTVRCEISADRVIHELARCAFSDILDLFEPQTGTLRMPRGVPIDGRRAVQSVRVSRERRTSLRDGTVQTTVSESVVEYRLWNKIEALSKLAVHFGLNQPVPPLDVLLTLLPRELADVLRGEMARRLLPPTASQPVPVRPAPQPPEPPQ